MAPSLRTFRPHCPSARRLVEVNRIPRKTAKAANTTSAADPLRALARRLKLPWRHRALLQLALTHSSAVNEPVDGAPPVPAPPGTDNEQLEFLGDAVLGLITSAALYREFPSCDEGLMTRLRSSLVDKPALARTAAAMGLAPLLQLGRSAEISGVRSRASALADAAEAVLAAVYLAEGLEAAERVVETFVIAPARAELVAQLAAAPGHAALRDAKTQLQERVQRSGLGRLRYLDLAESGPAHQRMFEVAAELATGDAAGPVHRLSVAHGRSKKAAQQTAAALALEAWEAFAAAHVAANGEPAGADAA